MVDDVDKAYRAFMLKHYGLKVVRALEVQNKQARQFTVEELKELIEKYK